MISSSQSPAADVSSGLSFAQTYERWLVGPLFEPWAKVLLDRAGITPGDRVLDIACGTGIVARLALTRLAGSGRVVGVDISPDMLAVARAVEPSIDWREGSASALPLHNGERFDVVVCQQGLQFFPDKPAAAREMRRALAPDGRLVVAVWKSLEETPFFRDLARVAERRLGTFVDRRHAFGDPLALQQLIVDAGFADVQVDGPSLTIRVADPAMLMRLNSRAVVGMSAASASMTEEERARLSDLITEDSAGVVRQYTNAGGLSFDLGAHVVTARTR